MTSFNTGNEQRDGDVEGENFLDIANYPAMTYRTTGIRQDGEVSSPTASSPSSASVRRSWPST